MRPNNDDKFHLKLTGKEFTVYNILNNHQVVDFLSDESIKKIEDAKKKLDMEDKLY